MTIQDFIDRRVRPCIGDTLYKVSSDPQLEPPQRQMAKYHSEVLLDYLNEGVLDISRNSNMFIKTGYILLRAGMTTINVPDDYQGFYDTDDFTAGEGTDFSKKYPLLTIQVTRKGFKLDRRVSQADIHAYPSSLKGIDLPSDVIDFLIESNQITPPSNPILLRDALNDTVLLTYQYKYLPKEYTLQDEITDRELMYLLKWWTASNALYGDMHNEAVNLGNLYYKKYSIRLQEAGASTNNMNSVSLTPWNDTYNHY